MAEDKENRALVPLRSSPLSVGRSSALTVSSVPSGGLPSGPHWFGTATNVTRKNTLFTEAHTAFLEARRKQSDAMVTLVDSRTTLAFKLADLRNVLNELFEQKQHERWKNEAGRQDERMRLGHSLQLLAIQQRAELEQLRTSSRSITDGGKPASPFRAQLRERLDAFRELSEACSDWRHSVENNPSIPKSQREEEIARGIAALQTEFEKRYGAGVSFDDASFNKA